MSGLILTASCSMKQLKNFTNNMATRTFQEAYAELEYYNKQNTLVYYRNNLTRNDFVKVKDELYVLSDQKTFRGLTMHA